ncbi:MAG: phosphonoacetaldehyde reductase [Eubacteriales bacterium]|nr:phosphonoacetaldehyde reductase [Eubacteriales bacterium]
MFSPLCPVDVRIIPATDGLRTVREWLDGPQKVLALSSASRIAALELSPFFAALEAEGHTVLADTAVSANPTVEDVAALLARLRNRGFVPTCILAVGGGSCIDLGKAASALYHLLPEPTAPAVREALQTKTYQRPHECVPLLALPTTAGTGSEVTRWATIWDPAEKRKLSLDHLQGFPKGAAIIPEWTAGMPAKLTLSTGLDALSHAMEAYWAVSRNPLSQELALLAVRKIRDALPMALADPGDLQARGEMALASLTAGLAFSQTRTTACHSISYPLTMLFGVPHGFAAAMTLSSVQRRNAKAVPEVDKLEAVFDVAEGFDAWMENTAHGIQLMTLSAFGIAETDLPSICDLAFTQGRMDNNPIVFTPDEVLDILRENL